MRRLKLGALLLVVVCVTAAVLVLTRSDERRADGDRAVPPSAEAPIEIDRPWTESDSTVLEDALPEDAAIVERLATARESIGAQPARVTGTLFLGDLPASGANVELRGPASLPLDITVAKLASLGAEHVVGGAPFVERTSSAADGSFELRPGIEEAGSYLLIAQQEHQRFSRLVELVPGQSVELGVLRFPTLVRIVGRVLDRFDELPAEGVWIQARWSKSVSRGSAAKPLQRAWVDADTREFVLDDVPLGRIDLVLELDELPELHSSTIVVEADGPRDFELEYSGRDLRKAVWVRFHPPDDPSGTLETSRLLAREHVRLRGEGRVLARAIRYRGVFLFPEVEPGTYDLIVDDPRFGSIGRSGLRPGRGIAVPIAGNAALQLEVRDAESGNVLTSYQAYLEGSDAYARIGFEVLQDEDEPLPEGALYARLIAGWDAVVISARGKGRTRIALDDLKPYQTLAIPATLGARRRVEGRVVDEAGRGVGGAEVLLREPPGWLAPRSPTHEFTDLDLDLLGQVASVAVSARALSDSDGNFSIDGARSGHCILTISVGSFACEPELLEIPEGDLLGLEIVARKYGGFRGRIRPASGGELAPCFLLMTDLEPKASRVFVEEHDSGLHRFDEFVHVASNGEFRTRTIPPGEYSLLLAFEDEVDVPLGTVTIQAGNDTERDFDVAENLPGRLEVEASWNGRPADGFGVQTIVAGPHRLWGELTPLDEAGRASLGSLEPGERVLRLVGLDRDNVPVHYEVVRIEPARTARIRIEARGGRGRLTALDPWEGPARREFWVGWETGRLHDHWMGPMETDDSGNAELLLAHGRYRFRTSEQEPCAGVWVEWTEQGPVPSVIHLPWSDR